MRQLVNRLSGVRYAAVAIRAAALVVLLTPSVQVFADDDQPPVPSEPFVLLLHGIYEPVVQGPEFGLSSVDLDDGTYSECDITRVSGLPGTTDQPVGRFYVNFDVTLCAYQLPGGTFAAVFDEFVYEFVEIDGEMYQVGTAELTITEANGIYRSFEGGTIHMEFVTRMIDDVTFEEFCFCYFSREKGSAN